MSHAHRMKTVLVRVVLAAMFVGIFCARANAQTINGTLMEVETDQPISLGLIILMTEAGDSITSGVTNSEGRFSVSAEESGSFMLIASAFGFKETAAGVFELGDGGEMDVEFRVAAAPMAIDGLLVSLQRPALEHNLVRNGFVRRITRGLGVFITPVDIERSAANDAADLFRGVPGVSLTRPGGGRNAFQGELLRMMSQGGYCAPQIYLDGARMSAEVTADMPIDLLVPLPEIEALEIYRRPAEIPIEYGMTGGSGTGGTGPCGVVVIWTRSR